MNPTTGPTQNKGLEPPYGMPMVNCVCVHQKENNIKLMPKKMSSLKINRVLVLHLSISISSPDVFPRFQGIKEFVVDEKVHMEQ